MDGWMTGCIKKRFFTLVDNIKRVFKADHIEYIILVFTRLGSI